MEPGIPKQIALARQTIDRLERLSVDSHWARRASGLKGSLIRWLEQAEADPTQADWSLLEPLLERGHAILTKAAAEIRTPDTRSW